MNRRRWIGAGLLSIAILTGSLSDAPRSPQPLTLGTYEVLQGDFHVHSSPLSWATLSPFETVIDARWEGLDVIALTPHNHTWVAAAGHWFSRWIDRPIVIPGEEIHALGFHILGIGITQTITWNQTAAQAIDEVHRQGGVAIAAHPTRKYWDAYDEEAMAKLDAAEIVHPMMLGNSRLASELHEFYSRRTLTAIGDTDYHGLGPLGLCRTFVFVHERSESAVLDALRNGRTVVYNGAQVYGDPELIQLAAADGRLPKIARTAPDKGILSAISRIAGIAALIALVL